VLSAVVPAGPDWMHELKYDGWRILARKDPGGVRLWSRNGRDWTSAFPAIVAALAVLPVETCILDAEAVTHNAEGWPDFHALHTRAGQESAHLVTFDLLVINGEDIRPWPLIERRAWLAELMAEAPDGLHFSEHLDDGKALMKHACALNLEGIVSKLKTSPYRSGRFDGWRKIKCLEYRRRE
jgi:bifunctional non-homologous end joining protein LigD